MLVREGRFAMAASEVSGGVGGRHGGGGKQVEELRVEGRDGSSHKHYHYPERRQTGEDANDPGITDQSRVGGGGMQPGDLQGQQWGGRDRHDQP